MVNFRRETAGLNPKQIKELNNGWLHARRIGLPLNILVSCRPSNSDDLASVDRCKLFRQVRNKLGVYARLRRFRPTFIWTREIHCDGTGEHLHVLIHVPQRLFGDFQQTLTRWFPEPGDITHTLNRSDRLHAA